MTKEKLKRRLILLDELLDVAMRTGCQFGMCNGPFAPIRSMLTCIRCAAIHKAIQMGLVKKTTHPHGDGFNHGMEQFSVIDGRKINGT